MDVAINLVLNCVREVEGVQRAGNAFLGLPCDLVLSLHLANNDRNDNSHETGSHGRPPFVAFGIAFRHVQWEIPAHGTTPYYLRCVPATSGGPYRAAVPAIQDQEGTGASLRVAERKTPHQRTRGTSRPMTQPGCTNQWFAVRLARRPPRPTIGLRRPLTFVTIRSDG